MTRDESIKLTIKSLLEVVQTGAKNIEISVLDGYGKIAASCYLTIFQIAKPPFRTWIFLKLKPLSKRLRQKRKQVGIRRTIPSRFSLLATEAERKRSRLAATAAGQASMSSRATDQPAEQ